MTSPDATPAPMSEDRFIEIGAMHRSGWRGSHAFYAGRKVLSDLYNEVSRLRALAGDGALQQAAERVCESWYDGDSRRAAFGDLIASLSKAIDESRRATLTPERQR